MSATAAAAIAGAATLAGAGISSYGSAQANKRGVELTREMRQSDIDMWNKTNAYNSPIQQMVS